MRIAAIAFTKKGAVLCSRLVNLLSVNHICTGYAKEKHGLYDNLFPLREGLTAWVEAHFEEDALVFVGAAGIAVRGIAPFIQGKDQDPAILVLDEGSRFVIPILSGHIGGANRLAEEVAALLGAVPVITTATDVNRIFAPDEWAARSGYAIEDIGLIKTVSSALLEGEPVGFHTEFTVKGALPAGLVQTDVGLPTGISVSLRTDCQVFPNTLRILPKCLYVGMGMKRGISMDVLEALFWDTLEESHLSVKSVAGISTIELKKNEPGLLALCQKYRLPLYWYPSEVLRRVKGIFTPSAFVEQVTGVDNVCERAAAAAAELAPVCGSGIGGESDPEGIILAPKRSFSGATIAICRRDWIVEFA